MAEESRDQDVRGEPGFREKANTLAEIVADRQNLRAENESLRERLREAEHARDEKDKVIEELGETYAAQYAAGYQIEKRAREAAEQHLERLRSLLGQLLIKVDEHRKRHGGLGPQQASPDYNRHLWEDRDRIEAELTSIRAFSFTQPNEEDTRCEACAHRYEQHAEFNGSCHVCSCPKFVRPVHVQPNEGGDAG